MRKKQPHRPPHIKSPVSTKAIPGDPHEQKNHTVSFKVSNRFLASIAQADCGKFSSADMITLIQWLALQGALIHTADQATQNLIQIEIDKLKP